MTDLSKLREAVFEQAFGVCEWPYCPHRAEELAHLEGRKMGGRKTAHQFENVAALCRTHHDLLDGRTVANRRYETRILLQEYLAMVRSRGGRTHD